MPSPSWSPAALRRTGLYIHWPFCQAKCPYCDFNSHVASRIDQEAWREAYGGEIARYAAERPDLEIGSIFFGGGTPTLMDPRIVAGVIDDVQRHWRITNDIEITLEANPTSVEAGRFAGYRAAGVGRVSLGVQALNDRDLRRLGRRHTVAEALSALDLARATFDRVSFDLIYARQDQRPEDWRAELGIALSLAADHLSLYQLTIEDGTAFGDRLAAGRLPGLPDEDRAVDMYELTQDMTAAAGLPAYEISNHAAPGSRSRHNMIYWRGGEYVGIGPGAHGRVSIDDRRIATEAESAPLAWLATVRRGEAPETRAILTSREVFEERVMMGLRIPEGVEIDEHSVPPSVLTDLQDLGLVSLEGSTLALTRRGRPLLNAILRQLLA